MCQSALECQNDRVLFQKQMYKKVPIKCLPVRLLFQLNCSCRVAYSTTITLIEGDDMFCLVRKACCACVSWGNKINGVNKDTSPLF